jgi:ribosome-associated protein
MLFISNNIVLKSYEIEISAIKAQGPGGQNVNKRASAIHLRFDIKKSSLPAIYKTRLLRLKDRRINDDGIIVIKAQNYRSQIQNQEDALSRLQAIIVSANTMPSKRIKKRMPMSVRRKRTDNKVKRGSLKKLRGKVKFSGND